MTGGAGLFIQVVMTLHFSQLKQISKTDLSIPGSAEWLLQRTDGRRILHSKYGDVGFVHCVVVL